MPPYAAAKQTYFQLLILFLIPYEYTREKTNYIRTSALIYIFDSSILELTAKIRASVPWLYQLENENLLHMPSKRIQVGFDA